MESLLVKSFFQAIVTHEITVMTGKLALAAFLGALIGLERDIHGRSAGLRTHQLVALGAALFMLISQEVAGADPSRIAAQIVSGIGFLGAGAIMKEGVTVRGLTTASCLWIVAALGMAVGIDRYGIAITTTLIALFSLSMLNNFDKLFKRESYRILTVTTSIDTYSEEILFAIRSKNIQILFVDYNCDNVNDTSTHRITLRLTHKGNTDREFSSIHRAIKERDIPIYKITWNHGEIN